MNSIRHHIYILLITFAGIAFMLGLESCHSGSKAFTAKPSHPHPSSLPTNQPQQQIAIADHLPEPAKAILREAESWIGVPYKYGGNDRNGIDCSGFVLQVFHNALNISLPRNSARQQQFCLTVHRSDMQIGDLVFFKLRKNSAVGHVGIYIGNGNMIHSSSSAGVVITPLDNPYFATRYHSTGRVERYTALIDADKKRCNKQPAAKPTCTTAKADIAEPDTTILSDFFE